MRWLEATEAGAEIASLERQLLLGETTSKDERLANLIALRAAGLALGDDTLNAFAAAREALCRGVHGRLAPIAIVVLKYCAWKAGALPTLAEQARQSGCRSERISRLTSSIEALAGVLDLTLTAAIYLSRLNVTTAEHVARCAVRRAEDTMISTFAPSSILARILYERDQLEEAETLLRPHLATMSSVGGLDCIMQTCVVLSRISAEHGDGAAAKAILDEGCELAVTRGWPRLLGAMLVERIRIYDGADCGRVSAWLEQLRGLSERHTETVQCARSDITRDLHRGCVSAFLIHKVGDRPGTSLAYLRYDAEQSQDLYAALWVDLAEIQLLWATGDQTASMSLMAKTLRTAESTGLRRHILDCGLALLPIMETLAYDVGLEHDLLAFALFLIDSLQRRGLRLKRLRPSWNADALTRRERDVLRGISEGFTNKSIALKDGVAPETIKTHIKNIFYKLNVQSRAQAVAKGQKLGVLHL